MAETTIRTVVELEKLGLYDELIKAYIAEKDAVKLQTVAFDEAANTINFYTIGQPVGETAPAFTVTLPEVDFTEVNNKISALETAVAGKADKATTLEGYGITDAYTKDEVDALVEDATYDDTTIKASVQANTDAISAINNADTGILAQAKAYADGKDEAIATAKKAGDDAQADVDALEKLVGTLPEGATATTVVGYAKEVADAAQAAATYNDTEVRGLISDNADAISALDTTVKGMYTNAQIDTAITTAVANADHLKRAIVDALPAVEDADANTIYMVSVADGTGNQKYEEFMLINDAFEKIGDSAVDLTDYATKTEVATAKTEAVDAAKEYADGLDTAMDARVDVLEAAIAEDGSVTLAIADAKKAGTDAQAAVTALETGAVATNTANITALQESVNAIQYASEQDIRNLFA